ncbi:MAG: hypothetical protein ACJAVT_002454 [Yoonia sp.]|jgi:hypothetical protein
MLGLLGHFDRAKALIDGLAIDVRLPVWALLTALANVDQSGAVKAVE